MKDQLNCNMYTRHHIAGGGCGTSAELSLDAYQVDNLSGGPSNVLTVGVSQPPHTSNVVLTNSDKRQFQYSEKYLCGRVLKNLTPHRMH